MKLLGVAFLSLVSTSAFASLYSTQNAAGYALSGTLSPVLISSTSGHMCTDGQDITGNEVNTSERISACMTSAALATSSTLLILKEEVQNVEPDAYAFLAGEEMTLALAEVVAKAQEEVPELQKQSDEAVVTFLISL